MGWRSFLRGVATTSGAVTATQLYGPYGAVRYPSGILPTDYGFTHQRADAVSGLDDYGARYYDPLAGQFTSADTTLAGGLNRYAYVGGNPETRTDPSGHIPGSPGHNFDLKLGYTQWLAQPVKVYAYQWAAPGTWQGFASYVGQAVLGTDTLSQSFHTLFQDPHASTGDKAKALGVGVFTAVSDLVTLVSIVTAQPEGVEGARAADAAVFAFADLDHLATGADAGVVGDLTGLPGGCGESFTPDTRVATPAGARAIAALKVGDHVTAYDPATGKQTTQTVERVFINHDRDRLDVTVAYHTASHTASHAAGQTASPTSATGHGRQAPATTRDAMVTEASAAQTEVIHTTASHPWLTTDRGWSRAGTLHVGEAVQLLDGGTATVVALHALPGVGAMWDLSLDDVHTFAVGDVQAVVHNCDFQTFNTKNAGAFDNEGESKATYNTLNRIKSGNPYKYPNADFPNDGQLFENREGVLGPKDATYYREYTVPGPGTEEGADPLLNNRRIVTGRGGDVWYSSDHYQSFTQLWWPW